jgi:hypothetical protein
MLLLLTPLLVLDPPLLLNLLLSLDAGGAFLFSSRD